MLSCKNKSCNWFYGVALLCISAFSAYVVSMFFADFHMVMLLGTVWFECLYMTIFFVYYAKDWKLIKMFIPFFAMGTLLAMVSWLMYPMIFVYMIRASESMKKKELEKNRKQACSSML